jgi:hypothetical integral membrane protein (TIGR02206 family)
MTLYGPDHWVALVTTAVLAGVLVVAGRKRVGEPWLGRALALLILLSQLTDPWIDYRNGMLSLQQSLPLELCDAASVAAIVALWTRHPLAFDLTYYWGLVGTMQGVFTPRLAVAIPDPEYFRYWGLHSGIVLAAIYLAAGVGMAPRRYSVWRSWGAAVALAVPVGFVDWALGANYMFLRAKPAYSILNKVGDWPWYIASMIGMLLVGMLIFWAVYWALHGARRIIAERITSG